MRRFGVLGAVAVLVVCFAASGVHAQTATTAQVGKPLALLAGLRPPHETRHHEARHLAHAKAEHEKTAGRTRRVRMAVHSRHAATKTFAARDHVHRERALTASAFAEEPPPQPAPDPQPESAPNWPLVTAAPAVESTPTATAPVAANTATGNDSSSADAASAGALPDPGPSPVQTLKITAANPTSLANSSADSTPAAAGTDDNAATAPMPAAASQTVLAAPVHVASKPAAIGSASWLAQMLAALGGAIAAGAVAWFLIGAGPVRTYG